MDHAYVHGTEGSISVIRGCPSELTEFIHSGGQQGTVLQQDDAEKVSGCDFDCAAVQDPAAVRTVVLGTLERQVTAAEGKSCIRRRPETVSQFAVSVALRIFALGSGYSLSG